MHRHLAIVLSQLIVASDHLLLVGDGFSVLCLASDRIGIVNHRLPQELIWLGAVDLLAQGLVDGLVLAKELLLEGVGSHAREQVKGELLMG
jgi:hypothetical protein